MEFCRSQASTAKRSQSLHRSVPLSPASLMGVLAPTQVSSRFVRQSEWPYLGRHLLRLGLHQSRIEALVSGLHQIQELGQLFRDGNQLKWVFLVQRLLLRSGKFLGQKKVLFLLLRLVLLSRSRVVRGLVHHWLCGRGAATSSWLRRLGRPLPRSRPKFSNTWWAWASRSSWTQHHYEHSIREFCPYFGASIGTDPWALLGVKQPIFRSFLWSYLGKAHFRA